MQPPLTTACRWTESPKGFTSLSCVNNGEVIPASRVFAASDAAMVGAWLKSVWKLFLLESKLIGVCRLEISIRFLFSSPVSGDYSATRPNQPPPPGSMQGIPDSVSIQEKPNDAQAGPGGCDKTGDGGTTVEQAYCFQHTTHMLT